ncbi:MAG TPA: STAS domain-containing protein [Phycisphaerae bacterium]|nr:STAS domain-containing protein [Phycisphaerae bacterium]
MAHLSAHPLVVEARRVGAGVVVHLAGAAEMAAAEGLRDRLEQLADQADRPIVLDLTDLEFLGSAALGALLSALARAGHDVGAIRLVHPQPFVMRVLETTRLTRLFPVYPTVDDALAD